MDASKILKIMALLIVSGTLEQPAISSPPSPVEILMVEGDSSGGGVPPAPNFGEEKISGKYMQYYISLVKQSDGYGELYLSDGVGGPSRSFLQVKKLRQVATSSHRRTSIEFWANKDAQSKADAKVLLQVSGKMIAVEKLDADWISALVSVNCRCSNKETGGSNWHVELTYKFANNTEWSRFLGNFIDRQTCQASYQDQYPACHREFLDPADYETTKAAITAAAANPKLKPEVYNQIAYCRGKVNFFDGASEMLSVRLLQGASAPYPLKVAFNKKDKPALTCDGDSAENWDLQCDDREVNMPAGFITKLSLAYDPVLGDRLARLEEYRGTAGRYQWGNLVCRTQEARTELEFTYSPMNPKEQFRVKAPEWVALPGAKLLVTYYEQGENTNMERLVIFTNQSTTFEDADVPTLHFANDVSIPLNITNSLSGPLVLTPWQQRIKLETIEGIWLEGAGIRIRYFDEKDQEWKTRRHGPEEP